MVRRPYPGAGWEKEKNATDEMISDLSVCRQEYVVKIINTDIGTWPKTIAVTARYLLSSFFTIAFQTACRNAAKIMAENIFRGMIYIVFKRRLIQYKFRII